MTNFRWLHGRLHRWSTDGDDGIAMLTVIAMGLILSIFVVAMTARSLTVTASSRIDRQREQALEAADGAAQSMISKALAGTSYNVTLPSDYATAFTTSYPQCERTWVLWAVSATANGTAPTPTCPTATTWTKPTSVLTGSSSDGTYKVLYAQDGSTNGVVYSVGYGPGTTQHQRVVRMEVQIKTNSSFVLNTAVLSNTDLKMTEGGNILGAGGNVHTNGALNSFTAGGTVAGNVSAGSCTGNACTNAAAKSCLPAGQVSNCSTSNTGVGAPVSIPKVTPRTYWPAADYALCPDSKIHLGPHYTGPLGTAPASSVVPCAAADPSIASTLNWSPSGSSWSYSSGSASTNAVYYAYQVNVSVTGGGAFNGSIISEGSGSGCSLTGGSVTLTGSGGFYPDTANTGIGSFAVIADGPLTVTAGGPSFGGIYYTNQYFTATGGGSTMDAAVVSNDTNSPNCGLNQMTGGGNWTYNNDLSFTSAGTPSATSTSWLEI